MERLAVSPVGYEDDFVLWREQQAQLLRAERREPAAHLGHIVACAEQRRKKNVVP
ncbi:DUF29 domain-containing protein [Massilia genomosp. 1]|uniref:DUF29 domain-containing protein n=1 Tax=Massilia genomosp. 1 TaxID=2609280 RepID=UPI0014230B7C|nr:DUF29 domain-containing protein [Massilia genomosp. 1]